MTKAELIERLSRHKGLPSGLTKKTVAMIVDGVFSELGDYFVRTKVTRSATPRFSYPGFGTFSKKRRSARTGRDPRNGSSIVIPATTTVWFAPGQDFKNDLNRGR